MGSSEEKDMVGTKDAKLGGPNLYESRSQKTQFRTGATTSPKLGGAAPPNTVLASSYKLPLRPKSAPFHASASAMSPARTLSTKTLDRTYGTSTCVARAWSSKWGKNSGDHRASMPSPNRGSSRSVASSTNVTGSWIANHEVPDFEINSLAAPTGEFWDHMRQYAFNQACREFPWHHNWNKQCPELKTRFIMQLWEVYCGPWEAKSILAAIGGNLRERRTRLKRKFEVYKNFKRVPCPDGCSKESWWQIYEDTKDEKKRSKATLCKIAAEKRKEAVGFSHKCGPRGLQGLRDRYVSSFNFT
jgi:hypothetical protein